VDMVAVPSSLVLPHSTRSQLGARVGSTEPRIWTPPLRELTPETSDGFDQVQFAVDVLHHPPLPWQEWLLIHAGELLPDGRPRFRIVIVLVARQNGKTEVPVMLAPFWMFMDRYPLTVGTSTKLEYAKETWDKTKSLIARSKALDSMHGPGRNWYVRGAMDTSMWAYALDEGNQPIEGEFGPRYKIAAANEEGGRSLTINRGIADELRQHKDYAAWGAFEPACSPEDAQIWVLSNAGSDSSVVLNDLRGQALALVTWIDEVGTEHAAELIAAGECPHDPRIGIFEWSAPKDARPDDPDALCQANPRVGYGRNLEDLIAEARRAMLKGGDALTTFQTEKMCIKVKVDNPAIDPGSWLRCLDPGTLDAVRGRLAACVDVSPDGQHISLSVAGVLPDGRVRVETAQAWDSRGRARTELPALVRKIKPKVLGWFPAGPGAALAADITRTERRENWPPAGTTVEAIRGDTSAACMGFEQLVRDGQLAHSGDPLQDAQVGEAERLKRGDAWVFVRHGDGHVDTVYAMAGAAHLARTMPAPIGKPRLLFAVEPDA